MIIIQWVQDGSIIQYLWLLMIQNEIHIYIYIWNIYERLRFFTALPFEHQQFLFPRQENWLPPDASLALQDQWIAYISTPVLSSRTKSRYIIQNPFLGVKTHRLAIVAISSIILSCIIPIHDFCRHIRYIHIYIYIYLYPLVRRERSGAAGLHIPTR